jgi:deoxyadenosine/deoxycytidine kinase
MAQSEKDKIEEGYIMKPTAATTPIKRTEKILFKKENLLIEISGLIGAGKTTLATKLSKLLGYEVSHEIGADETRLREFYGNKEKFAMSFQYFLLNQRTEQHEMIRQSKKNTISDRSMLEDAAFVTMFYEDGIITEDQKEIYLEMLKRIYYTTKGPDIILHLQVTPEESFERVNSRNREYETKNSGVPLEYLRHLSNVYDRLIPEMAELVPVVILPWSKFEENTVVVVEALKKVIANLWNPKTIWL